MYWDRLEDKALKYTVGSLVQAWGILEDREGNVGVARVLFKRALRVDSQNVPTWMSWAAMEERQGNAVRADELRNLCLQQVQNNSFISNQLLQCLTVLSALPVVICISLLISLILELSRISMRIIICVNSEQRLWTRTRGMLTWKIC